MRTSSISALLPLSILVLELSFIMLDSRGVVT